MHEQIRITTGARLHFGFLADPQPKDGGCAYGGLGVMIDRPGYRVTVRRAAEDFIRASSNEIQRRVPEWLKCYRESVDAEIGRFEIDVDDIIPSHRGLGSGTQGALAVAQAVSLLTGESATPVATLAKRVGRGARSAIGIHGFQRGGLLVEGGKKVVEDVGKLLVREDFPSDWRFVLVAPPGTEGYSGHIELQAFAELPPMAKSMTERLCRLVLLEILPAVQEHDADRFGAALGEYGDIVGGHFAPLQGGTFASPLMAALAAELRHEAHKGIAQSSWGPTIAILCPTAQVADALTQRLREDNRFADCDFYVAGGMNCGAVLEFGGSQYSDGGH